MCDTPHRRMLGLGKKQVPSAGDMPRLKVLQPPGHDQRLRGLTGCRTEGLASSELSSGHTPVGNQGGGGDVAAV